jgi:hypothetical protein
MNPPHRRLASPTLFATLAAPCWLAAQEILKRKTQHVHHRLVELVMLGSPYTYGSAGADGFRILNNARTVPRSVETATHRIGFGFDFRMST